LKLWGRDYSPEELVEAPLPPPHSHEISFVLDRTITEGVLNTNKKKQIAA
jgi:hypothetical protein